MTSSKIQVSDTGHIETLCRLIARHHAKIDAICRQSLGETEGVIGLKAVRNNKIHAAEARRFKLIFPAIHKVVNPRRHAPKENGALNKTNEALAKLGRCHGEVTVY